MSWHSPQWARSNTATALSSKVSSWVVRHQVDAGYAAKVFGKGTAVACGRFTTSRAVVPAGGRDPVPALRLLLSQDLGGNREVLVGIQTFAGRAVAVAIGTY